MTGFKLASIWSSKSDQHVKEDSDAILTDKKKKKKKKSFFGFVTGKKSKKDIDNADKPSLSEEDSIKMKANAPNALTFTSNPLKNTSSSPSPPPSPVKTFSSVGIVSNTEKSLNSGTLPNGRLNPLSMIYKKKGISTSFSPSKANTQTAVLNTSPQQLEKNSSFDKFLKEYEKDWAGSYPEHKESSNHGGDEDDDDDEDDDEVPLYGGRFYFTNDSDDNSSKNDSSNVSSRVVSLSIQPEALQNVSTTAVSNLESTSTSAHMESVTEQQLKNSSEVGNFGNVTLSFEKPSDSCIEIEEKKMTIDEKVEINEEVPTSDQASISTFEQSVSIATAAQNANLELSRPENCGEVESSLNINASSEENLMLRSKAEEIAHTITVTNTGTNHSKEFIGESEFEDKLIESERALIAEANEDILHELQDKQSTRNISDDFQQDPGSKDEIMKETNSTSLDLHGNEPNVVGKCHDSNVMLSTSVETIDTAAILIHNTSNIDTNDATQILPIVSTEAEPIEDDFVGHKEREKGVNNGENENEGTTDYFTDSGKDASSMNNDVKKVSEVYENIDSVQDKTRSDSSDIHIGSSTPNIPLSEAVCVNEIEAHRDRTHMQVNTEIGNILSSKSSPKITKKNEKAMALLQNAGMTRNSCVEKPQEIIATTDIDLKASNSTTADPVDVTNKKVDIVKNFSAMAEEDEAVSNVIQKQRSNDTPNAIIDTKAKSNESIVITALPDVEIKNSNCTSTKGEAGSNTVQIQSESSISNDSDQKVPMKKSIGEQNRKVLAVVKNIEASSTSNGNGKIQKQSPFKGKAQNSQLGQITGEAKKSNNSDLFSDDNDEYSRELAINKRRRLKSKDAINIDIPENDKITFDDIGTRSKNSLESEKVENNAETNGDLANSKQAYGSSAIPYLALREKPPPVLSRSRTRVSHDSNEKEEPIPSKKSCDANDVHVDLINIYDEPSEDFLSSFISESSRSNIERNDSMLTTSVESIDGYQSPKLLPFPYLSSKGLMKIDSTDVPTISSSNNKPTTVSNSKSQRKHKSVDSFFDNPFDDIIEQLSYTHSAENEVLDLGYDLEISDCTADSVSHLQEVEDQCPYEYKDIMKIDSAESIDFIMNPLRNPSNKSDSSDHQRCDKELSASTQEETTTQWNWRSVVAGTPSPSLSMMAPSLVKPDGRKRGSRSFSRDFASGEDSTSLMKEPACELPKQSVENALQPDVSNSSASLPSTKHNVKAHRRSGDMIDMDSCLASLLQNPSSINSDAENDGYSVPSIRKVAREIRKQFQTQSFPESNCGPTDSDGIPPSNQHENGQQSLQRIRLKAAEVSDYRIKVAQNAKLSIEQPIADSSATSLLMKAAQQSSPQKKVCGFNVTLLSPSPRKNAQTNPSATKNLQNKLSSPTAAKKAAIQSTSGSKPGEPRSSTKAPSQRSKSDHAIEAVDRALRSASTTAANINRLCNVLQPQPQKENQTVNKARSYSPATSTQLKPALVEKCTSPSVNKRLDLLMGRGSKSPEKCALFNKDDLIHDAELLEKNKVTLSESLVSFDRNVVKEAQRRKLTLAAKLDLQILKEVVESVNRLNFLTAKAKKSMTSMSVEEKKELKALTNEKARHDRVHDFANSDRSSKKFTSNERIMLQPLKQELERKIKFSRLYRKHKKNEPFSFEEKAEYILLKESLEAEKRFEQLLLKFNSYADEEQRAEKLKREVTVFERVELIILKLEQDKQQRYEFLLSKEKSSLASSSQPKLNLAERSELIIIKKEIELQYKQHQEKVALLAQQLRQGYTYSASIDPFAAAVSSTRTNGETMANMVNKAYSISMDGYDTNSIDNLNINDDEIIPSDQQSRNDFSAPSFECKSRNAGTNTVEKPLPYHQSVDIREEAGKNRAGKTTVITITIKDNSMKKGVNFIHDKSGGKVVDQPIPQDASSVSRAKTEIDKYPATTSSMVGNEPKKESSNKVAKIAKIAEEKIRTYFAEKENELSREKQKKLEDFLRRSICSESDSDSCNNKSEESNTKPCGAPQDTPSFSSSSGESIGISLTETYDSYSHFNITQKAELNLLKLEGEKQRRLEEEKQRKLAQFLEVVDETDNSSLNSAKLSAGSQSLSSKGSVHHKKANSFSSASNAGSLTNSVTSKTSKNKLEVPTNKSSAVEIKSKADIQGHRVSTSPPRRRETPTSSVEVPANKSSAVEIKSKATTINDIQGHRVSTSPPRKRETPSSSLGLEVLTKVAAKPLRPEVMKKRLGSRSASISSDSADKISQELPTAVTPAVATINDGSSALNTKGGVDEDPRKQRSVSTPSNHQRLLQSSASVSSTTNSGRPRRQPAIVQIFEQAKELHRKAEIERIESLKNDPSRKINDPPFSLILGSSYAGQDKCDSNT